MHVLDWVEEPGFLTTLNLMLEPTGFAVPLNANWQPKGRMDHRESVLTGSADPFLTPEQSASVKDWWLVYSRGSKLPTWDLVVTCSDSHGKPGLVLVEAKAHSTELSIAGKSVSTRKTLEEQARSDANHERIGMAVREASEALMEAVPGISLSRDENYQFCNRIAFAWKLGSLGIPVVLIYLGYLNDTSISTANYLRSDDDWKQSFVEHTKRHYPHTHIEREVPTGNAPFWLTVRSLECLRPSPPVSQRKPLK